MAGPIAVAQQFALTAPPTPAAAALELLTPAAKTAPPGDDHILGRLLAKAPPPPGVEKPPRDDQILGRLLAKAPPPPNPEKDAQLLGGLIAKEARDASVLDGFLRKHGAGDVRRKPPPLTLDTPKARDDAVLQQLVGRGAQSGLKALRVAESLQVPSGQVEAPGFGYPVARRSAERLRLGRGGRRDAGGRGKVRTDIIEERAKDDLQEENLQLKKQQSEMKFKLQKLQAQMKTAQELQSAKGFEQKASELMELQRAWSAPRTKAVGRAHELRSTSPARPRSRQPSQRGRLRMRMNAVPFQANNNEVRPTSPAKHVLPALHVQPEPSISRQSSPRGHRSPRAQDLPRSPSPRPMPPLEAKEPLPAHTLGSWLPSAPSPKAQNVVSDLEQHLVSQQKQKVDELRQRNRELSSRLDELLMQQISADHHSEKQKSKYREKSKAQDAKIKSLEAALERQRHKVRASEGALQHDRQQLEIDVAVLATELHHAQVQSGGGEDTAGLRLQLAEAMASADDMKRQIRDITKFAFSGTDQRVISAQRMQELEDLLGKKTEECEKLAADYQGFEAECNEARRDAVELDQQSRNYLEDNERKAIQMDEWAKAVRRAQSQLVEVLQTLPEEDRKVMVFSLQFLREREEKAAQEVAERVEQSRSAGSLPSPPGICSVDELSRRVDAIRAEKDELASEVRALQDISQREREITRDLRKIHQMDLEEIGSQMQVTLSEIERFKKSAVDREERIKELQLRLVKRKESRLVKVGPLGERAEVVSQGGFSDLSDVLDAKNVLDLYITSGFLEERALLELPRQGAVLSQVPPATSLVTLVIAEFMQFDVGSSETAGGLRPRYDSLLSFGPFEMGDAEVEHFARGAVRLELQAFSSGGSAACVLGRASLPLAALLDCTPQDPNPVVAGTLYFASEEDSRVQIAAIRYKARWRRSIMKDLENYALRRGLSPHDVVAGELAGAARAAAPGLMDAAKGLIVQVFNVTSLVALQPERLRPYVSYEVVGHKTHFTATGSGPNVAFEDIHRMVVRVDRAFCKWLENSGGLHFLVFDAAVPPGGASEEQIGLIGEVVVPLLQLLESRNARVAGSYPLSRGTSTVGNIELAVAWQDDPTSVVAGASILEADRGALTEEQFQVLWQRVIRRLHVLKMAPVDWFYRFDADKDGFWSKAEFCAALGSMPLGLSVVEIEYVFHWTDRHRRMLVTLDDLAAAFEQGKRAAPLEQWARDIFRRLAAALKRQGWTAKEAFDAVAQHRRAQKSEFYALVNSLDLGLSQEQLEWLWKLSDTNSDGLLDYHEFAQRIVEVSGISSTAYPVPNPEEDVSEPPSATITAAAAAAAMSEAWRDICLARLLRGIQAVGWTLDKAMEYLPVREDGLVSRAELRAFASNCRAAWSDWELDKVFTAFDQELRGAIPKRSIQTALMYSDVLESPAQASIRRAVECLSRIHQAMLRYRPATTEAALQGIFLEVAAMKQPLQVQREELAVAAERLGVEKVWLDELWFAAPKQRDNTLDIESFSKQVELAPLPGEDDAASDEDVAILLGRLGKALVRFGGAEKAFHSFQTGADGCLSRAEMEMAIAEITKDLFSAHERMVVVRRMDTNSDGRISLKELEDATAGAGVSARVAELFTALVGLKATRQDVPWEDFRALLSQLEPTLQEEQLEHLWRCFGTDGDGHISREEFRKALSSGGVAAPARVTQPRPGEAGSASKPLVEQSEVLARLALALQRQNKNVDDLFNVLAREGVVSWPDFKALFQEWEPSLGEKDLHGLWRSFDKDGDGSVTRDEFIAALAPSLRALKAQSDDICGRVASMLFQNGRTVNQLFDALAAGKEHVIFEDFRSLFQQLEPSLTLADLQALWRSFDRDGDGGVTRQEFLKQMAPAARLAVSRAAEVCEEVGRLLRERSGRSRTLDGLFDELAQDEALHWDAFCNFFRSLSSEVSEEDLHGLWRSFDKDGDGKVSRQEFVKALESAMPSEVPQMAEPELTDALWQALAEVATLRAGNVPRGSEALRDALRQQLASFDLTRTGFLEPSTFSRAMRSYSPLPDAVLEVLQGQVCEPDGRVQIDRVVNKILQPPELRVVKASQRGDPLWNALRRLRPALHERSLRLNSIFQRWASNGRLTCESLGLGAAGLVGELSEAELQALFESMSRNDLGASQEDFVQAFGAAEGQGFTTFVHELLGRTGRALLSRAKGSISGAFATLDLTGEGEVRLIGFRAALLQFGDLNLTEDQVQASWELAKGIGGYEECMDMASFKKVFGAHPPSVDSGLGAPPPPPEDGGERPEPPPRPPESLAQVGQPRSLFRCFRTGARASGSMLFGVSKGRSPPR